MPKFKAVFQKEFDIEAKNEEEAINKALEYFAQFTEDELTDEFVRYLFREDKDFIEIERKEEFGTLKVSEIVTSIH